MPADTSARTTITLPFDEAHRIRRICRSLEAAIREAFECSDESHRSSRT